MWRNERNCKFHNCISTYELKTAANCIFVLVCFWQLIDDPFDVFEENGQFRRAPPMVRVEKMFENIQSKLPGAPQFLLCLLPERKNSDLYG